MALLPGYFKGESYLNVKKQICLVIVGYNPRFIIRLLYWCRIESLKKADKTVRFFLMKFESF